MSSPPPQLSASVSPRASSDSSAELQKLRERLNEGLKREMDLEKMNRELQQQLKASKEEVTILDSKLDRSKAKILELEEERRKDQLAAASVTAVSSSSGVDSEVEELREKLKKEGSKLRKLTEQIRTLEETNDDLTDKVEDLNFAKLKLERTLKVQQEELEELRAFADTGGGNVEEFKMQKDKELAELRETWLTAKEKSDAQIRQLQRELGNKATHLLVSESLHSFSF